MHVDWRGRGKGAFSREVFPDADRLILQRTLTLAQKLRMQSAVRGCGLSGRICVLSSMLKGADAMMGLRCIAVRPVMRVMLPYGGGNFC